MIQTPNQFRIPAYLKFSVILLGLCAFFYSIYAAQGLLIPMVFSVLVAILLNPIINFLTRKRMNKIVAILITLFVALLLMSGLLFFIISQFNMFAEDLPDLRSKFTELSKQVIGWISETFNINEAKIRSYIEKTKGEGLNNSGKALGNAASTVSQAFVLLLLIPVYIFLILFYKPLLLKFISMLFPKRLHGEVVDVLAEIRVLVQHYLSGLLIELAIVATLSSLGLFFIGIQSPILFGILAALLNTIPYVGVLIANISIVAVAFVTKGMTSAIIVFALFVVVQFIDNNIIVPRIVGAKVKINALATIIIVLIGGELCGVAGMFLAIPVLGILKVIFDRIPTLEPLGYLMGDEMPTSVNNIFVKRVEERVEEKKEE